MVNLERDREGEFNLALAKLEGLRAEGEPKRQYVLAPHTSISEQALQNNHFTRSIDWS